MTSSDAIEVQALYPPAVWAQERVSDWLERFAEGSGFRTTIEHSDDDQLVIKLVRSPAHDVPACSAASGSTVL